MTASMTPQIDGKRIVWTDSRTIATDIYMVTLEEVQSPLRCEFSSDVVQGPPPLTVNFDDLSTGNIVAWVWDFGDGTISREKNPDHTYQQEGLYSVSLTVSNPYQRNATSLKDMIAVGSSPSADFMVNVTSGPSPVCIRFTDISTGYPGGWKWDFGDGTESEEQNPVHIFAMPGFYTVNLTVNNTFGSDTKSCSSLVTSVPNILVTQGFAIPGLELSEENTVRYLRLNTNEMGEYKVINPSDGTEIGITCPAGSGIQKIVIYPDMYDFSIDGSIIMGNSRGMQISGVVPYTGLPDTSQHGGSFSYIVDTNQTTPNATFTTVMWDGVLPDDYKKYEQLVLNSGYAGIGGSAFTARFIDEDQVLNGPAVVTMSVSSAWVQKFGQRQGTRPEEDTVRILRAGEDGAVDILNTTFAGIDPVTNIEYFRAESPKGLSSFTLATLTGTGNPLQLAYLSVSSRVSAGGGGGGIGIGGNPTPSPVAEEQKFEPENKEEPIGGSISETSESIQPESTPGYQVTPSPPGLPGQPHGATDEVIAATSQTPGTSIFTALVQGSAIVSVVLIVLFSIYVRYRKQE